MKKEPRIVQCPKAARGECTKNYCRHRKEHEFCSSCSPDRHCPACEPVKPKNVVALLKSITHWDLIAQGLEESHGTENCECCKQFYDNTSCSDCLITANGHYRCKDTPYMEMRSWCLTKNQTPEALDAIEAEVEFLISCLPEPEQKAFSLENVQPFLRFGDKVWLGEEQVGFLTYVPPSRCRIWHFGPAQKESSGYFANEALSNLSLFPPKPEPQLWETLEVGQPVWVWGRAVTKDRAFLRIFQAVSNMPSCLIKTTEFGFESNTCNWENFRLLTRAEAQKLGFDLNRWQWADDETQKGETK